MGSGIDHHLQQHGKGFRVVKEIPAPFRAQFNGKRFLIKALGPVTPQQARLLRGPILSAFELEIARARNGNDPVLQRARTIRRQWEEDERNAGIETAFMDAVALADEVQAQDGEEQGDAIFNMALGHLTPLDEYLEAWITAENFNGKVALLHRSAFKELAAHCEEQRIPKTLQAITKKRVWEFIEQRLKPSSAVKTVNRKLSTFRTHWRWLMRRSRVEANPWLDTTLSEANKSHVRAEDDGKTAFTDEQVRKLLDGNAPGALSDLMLIAALTGARINAICELRVRDCKDATFTFKRAKMEPADRTIPMHSKLKAIVAKRTRGKTEDAFLFEELPEATATRPRSASSSQAFTRYRKSLGIGAAKGEASRYDFHSFRRWFTTKAEQAGQPPHVIDYVTGHKRPGETLGRYSQGPSMAQMRKCVEAVKLP